MILYRLSESCGWVPEWPKGADCKSVVDDFGGSNPPAPTKAAWNCDGSGQFYFCAGKISADRRLSVGGML